MRCPMFKVYFRNQICIHYQVYGGEAYTHFGLLGRANPNLLVILNEIWYINDVFSYKVVFISLLFYV